MSESKLTQEVVTKVAFPLTVGAILDYAEAISDRPRGERVELVKLGPLGGQFLRHRRDATELPPTSVPGSVEPGAVHKMHVSLLASEAIRLAREGHDVLALFASEQAMHGWADYEIRGLQEKGGTDFRVCRSGGFWTVVFIEPVNLAPTGMAAFGIAGPTYTGSYDKVLTDARVPSLP